MNTSSGAPTLSIALVTRNRLESLGRALQSIRSQCCQPYEIVVSDDSDQQHQGSVQRIAAQFTCRYVPGPRRGLYANRNQAALTCSGSHIRTMDDDHELPPGHLACCLNALHSHPEIVWVIGERQPGAPENAISYPGQLNARGHAEAPRTNATSWALADGSTIFPRSVFDIGQRYHESFGFGATYLELGSRLHWLGYRLAFLTGTSIIHHSEESIQRRDSVWYGNQVQMLASRLFAALCHSHIYQPSVQNKLLMMLEFGKQLLLRPRQTMEAWPPGLAAYRGLRRELTKSASASVGRARREP